MAFLTAFLCRANNEIADNGRTFSVWHRNSRLERETDGGVK